jgi:hypothetical protein
MSWGQPNASFAGNTNQIPPHEAFELQATGNNAIAERDRLLAEWDAKKKALEEAKAGEMEARKAVFAFNFPNPQPGVNRVELNNGYKLKATHKLNYKFEASLDAIDEAEDKCCKLGAEAKFLAERIICWKAEPSVSEYKKLDMSNPLHVQVKAIVDGILDIKPGAPTLEIEAPK